MANAAKVRCRSRVDPEELPTDVGLSSLDGGADGDQPEDSKGSVLGSVAAVGGLCLLIAGGFLFKDQIRAFLLHFTDLVDDMGAVGWVLYALVYAGLEVLAVPAIPLTMASGAIFGIVPGSILVSLSGTIAATISFLIARYAARDRVRCPCHSPAQPVVHKCSKLRTLFFVLDSLHWLVATGQECQCLVLVFRSLCFQQTSTKQLESWYYDFLKAPSTSPDAVVAICRLQHGQIRTSSFVPSTE